MTTATDHKNNLLKKDYARTLRVETIANSAGGTAQVSIVAQPSIGRPLHMASGASVEERRHGGGLTLMLTQHKAGGH